MASDPELGSVITAEPELWGVEQVEAERVLIRLAVKTVPLEQWRVARALRARLKARARRGGHRADVTGTDHLQRRRRPAGVRPLASAPDVTELLVFLLIVLLAVVLIAGGLFLSRRGSRGADRCPTSSRRPPTVEAPPPKCEVARRTGRRGPEASSRRAVRERPRLRDRLGKTRAAFSGALTRRGKIDPETWDDLEEALLLADVGMPTTQRILEDVKARRRGGEGVRLRGGARAAQGRAARCCSSRATASCTRRRVS